MERRAPRISIHAPRVGGDMEKLKSKISNTISIHAPRVGGDSVRHFTLPGFHYFNPRPPCGGRQTSLNNSSRCVEFQSTPPVWGATWLLTRRRRLSSFQSTPPVWGATVGCQTNYSGRSQFQSTPPVWGATDEYWRCATVDRNFNPRPPCGGRQTISPKILDLR